MVAQNTLHTRKGKQQKLNRTTLLVLNIILIDQFTTCKHRILSYNLFKVICDINMYENNIKKIKIRDNF